MLKDSLEYYQTPLETVFNNDEDAMLRASGIERGEVSDNTPFVVALARSSATADLWVRRVPFCYLRACTAYSVYFERPGGGPLFYYPDYNHAEGGRVPRLIREKRVAAYEDQMEDYWKLYKTVVTFPISRQTSRGTKTAKSVFGYLCIDSTRPVAFRGLLEVPEPSEAKSWSPLVNVLLAVADACGALFSLDRIIERATDPGALSP